MPNQGRIDPIWISNSNLNHIWKVVHAQQGKAHIPCRQEKKSCKRIVGVVFLSFICHTNKEPHAQILDKDDLDQFKSDLNWFRSNLIHKEREGANLHLHTRTRKRANDFSCLTSLFQCVRWERSPVKLGSRQSILIRFKLDSNQI